MKATSNCIADLAERIAERAGALAPRDEELRRLLVEMQELRRVLPTLRIVPPARRNRADVDDDLDELFNNMPI